MAVLALEIEVTVAAGGPARFLLRLRNGGNTPVDLSFRSGRRFEITVTDSAEAEVWRWSAGRRFTQSMREEQIAPAATHTYTAAWDRPPPGRYRARAEMAAGDAPPATCSFVV